ncbi:MAG: group III truncated hemoglobin [Planctomycetota bacterium]
MDVLQLRARLGEADIDRLVAEFYQRVRADPLLAPVFAARIADDAWPAHLQRIAGFWVTILLGVRRYLGDPMQPHAGLTTLGADAAELDRWLALWREVALQTLGAEVGEAVAHRAELMRTAILSAMRRPAAAS